MILDILIFPDPRLREHALEVQKVDDDVKQLIKNMFETMYYTGGIGLAATQVNVRKRIVVMDLSVTKDEPMVFINPEVTIKTDNLREFEEGCLSVPGYSGAVSRPDTVLIRALDGEGKPFEMEATDLLAVCIQHEIDHLNGVVFVDYLSNLKKEKIRKDLRGQNISPREIAELHKDRSKKYADQVI